MPTSHPFDRVPGRPGGGRWGRTLDYHLVTGSTNDDAHRAAAAGARDGHIIVADSQEAGRGRHGRVWAASKGENILVSFVLRPAFEPDRWTWIPLAASVAVSDTIGLVAPGLSPRVKWPNDVRLGGLKVSGILAESRIDTSGSGYVVLGIGLNLNQAAFDGDLGSIATSLRRVSGRSFDRAVVLGALCDAMEYRLTSIGSSPASLVSAYRTLLDGVSTRVSVRHPVTGDGVEGILEGIDDQGALVLSTATGRRTFSAGEVTLRPV